MSIFFHNYLEKLQKKYQRNFNMTYFFFKLENFKNIFYTKKFRYRNLVKKKKVL